MTQDVVGIDTGITMLMAENARTGFVWETFMKNPEAQRGMAQAGFQPILPRLLQLRERDAPRTKKPLRENFAPLVV